MDGTQVQLRSVALGKYLCAENGGGTVVVANRASPSGWETLKLWRVDATHFQFRVFFKQFVAVNNGGYAVAVTTRPGPAETFEIVRRTGDPNRVRIRAPNGLFLQGLARAPTVMREHWQSFIVEEDFKFIKDNGLNAVRVPVGGGSPATLLRRHTKYGLKVIIDLHAAPGSQNGDEHSGGRDGIIEWGVEPGSIEKTVSVIEFLAQRYASRPSLIAVELINEPRAEGVGFDTLKSYYQAGYDAVRRHTSTAYVIFSARLSADAGEFIPFTSGLDGTVLDVHYYNLFSDMFDGWTAQQNIDYVHNQRANQLAVVTKSNGRPLSFVGEWVAEWNVNNATSEDYRRFAEAQLKVLGNASFGWAYWTYKCEKQHWSLRWMITNGYISLV
ncbi:unnamed protein product [Spirodela intermedia]|uniref:Uncharacterized protein n=1 Tax=Spirodela intermedia TaxID=51605 RepID=A0A7I8KT80_SPIIN|nr:unnamed protein product [Spirodela intermedia]